MTLIDQITANAGDYHLLQGQHISLGLETVATRVGWRWHLVVRHGGGVLGYHPLGWFDSARLTRATKKMIIAYKWSTDE